MGSYPSHERNLVSYMEKRLKEKGGNVPTKKVESLSSMGKERKEALFNRNLMCILSSTILNLFLCLYCLVEELSAFSKSLVNKTLFIFPVLQILISQVIVRGSFYHLYFLLPEEERRKNSFLGFILPLISRIELFVGVFLFCFDFALPMYFTGLQLYFIHAIPWWMISLAWFLSSGILFPPS